MPDLRSFHCWYRSGHLKDAALPQYYYSRFMHFTFGLSDLACFLPLSQLMLLIVASFSTGSHYPQNSFFCSFSIVQQFVLVAIITTKSEQHFGLPQAAFAHASKLAGLLALTMTLVDLLLRRWLSQRAILTL